MKESMIIIIFTVIMFMGIVAVDETCSVEYGNEPLLYNFVYGKY